MSRLHWRQHPLPIIVLLITAMFLVMYACRKTDYSQQQKVNQQRTANFFLMPAGTDPLIRSIAGKIRTQDDQFHFVNELVGRVGYPKWDKSLIGRPPESASRGTMADSAMTYAYIPFADSSVDAILIVGITATDTLFRLLNDFEYTDFSMDPNGDGTVWTARNMFHMFSYFEKEVFNHRKFRMLDHRLFPGADTTRSTVVTLREDGNKPVRGRPALMQYIQMCSTFDVCYGDPEDYENICDGECTTGCSLYQYSYDDCVGFWHDGGGWSGSQPPIIPQGGYYGGGGNSGTGGGAWWPNLCSGNTYCGNHGWHAEPSPDEIPWNAYIADSVIISNGLRDVFPCIYHFINDSLPNANVIAQLAGEQIFYDSAWIHLEFDTSSTLTTENVDRAGTTFISKSVTDGYGHAHFKAKIELNPWTLRNCPRESVYLVIIHEIMHAILDLRWYQYRQWYYYNIGDIDSNFMRDHYPADWYYMTNLAVSPTALQEHETMAAKYYDTVRSIVMKFWNPAVPTSLRDSVIRALCYGGLAKTTVWKNLPSHGIDTCWYVAILSCAEHGLNGPSYHNGPDCRTYSLTYSDSLGLRPPCN